MNYRNRCTWLFLALLFTGLLMGSPPVRGNSDEEFVGPFPSWRRPAA